MKKLPVHSRESRVRIAYAASPMISGLREPFIVEPPPSRFCTAAVAITARGHSALTATPADLYSPAMPSTHMLMPNFAIVYATCGENHRVSMLSGGDMFKTCGFAAFFKCGMQVFET